MVSAERGVFKDCVQCYPDSSCIIFKKRFSCGCRMKLFEFEGKDLLQKAGVAVPKFVLLDKPQQAPFLPCVVKAQVLAGKRKKGGIIMMCKSQAEFADAMKLFGSAFQGEEIKRLLVEELVDIKQELYVSFCYDTDVRGAVLLYSEQGGIDVEEMGNVKKVPLSEIHSLKISSDVADAIKKIQDVFVKEDCRLVEVNPLAVTSKGLMALGAMVELDDAAAGRQKERTYPPRGAQLREREQRVKVANDADYHGTVKYVEMNGDIGMLAAGGGASLTCMDALIQAGGRPANFSEFSGNPSADKVYVLAKTVMTKPGVRGLWIVGAVANFSPVDVMMEGIIRALNEVQPKFPIVVRRAGPKEKEGLQMLKDAAIVNGWDIEVHGSETALTATAKLIVQKVK